MAAGTDPLTSVEALIAMIEPGPRLIDGTLLKQLYVMAHKYDVAASIEPGPRLIDVELLKLLAKEIEDFEAAELFRVTTDTGKRLIDGTPWKALALEAKERSE